MFACSLDFSLSLSLFVALRQHSFIKSAKPNSILRALITDAMEIKLKIQEEAEQRAQDAEDDDNSVCTRIKRRGESVTAVGKPEAHIMKNCIFKLFDCDDPKISAESKQALHSFTRWSF